ncbi:hypothetical protein EUX98_g5869 [Antrodiella citrinella]|uniref:Uncharacterized protein n=1 Tax=Antrodiella citrinella TaxID=2447956 RepID=A0A4S4MQE4_9APHY|nr:hypothetical protein EUX98_g5869 [Antrodiella citrinella]
MEHDFMRRHIDTGFTGHALSMGAWGFVGYWAYQWDIRAGELIAAKTAEIREKRAQKALAAGAHAEES